VALNHWGGKKVCVCKYEWEEMRCPHFLLVLSRAVCTQMNYREIVTNCI
jgi:hypothetical protein